MKRFFVSFLVISLFMVLGSLDAETDISIDPSNVVDWKTAFDGADVQGFSPNGGSAYSPSPGNSVGVQFVNHPLLNNSSVTTDGTSVLLALYDFVSSGFDLHSLKDALMGDHPGKKHGKKGKKEEPKKPTRHYYYSPNSFEILYFDDLDAPSSSAPQSGCRAIPEVVPPSQPQRPVYDPAIVAIADAKRRSEASARDTLKNIETAAKQSSGGMTLPVVALQVPIESVHEELYVSQLDQMINARKVLAAQDQNNELAQLGKTFLRQIEVDLCRHDGPIVNRKTYKRLIAATETFVHPDAERREYPIYGSRLSSCYGNSTQQNIHEEVVDIVRKNEWWSLKGRSIPNSTVPNFFELTNIVLELKEAKQYKKAYSCSDFCSSLFDSTLARGLLMTLRGMVSGVENFSSGFKAAVDGVLDRLLGCERFTCEDTFCLCNHSNTCIFCNKNGWSKENLSKTLVSNASMLQDKWEMFATDVDNFGRLWRGDPEAVTEELISKFTQSALELGVYHIGFLKVEPFSQVSNFSVQPRSRFGRKPATKIPCRDVYIIGTGEPIAVPVEKSCFVSKKIEIGRTSNCGYKAAIEEVVRCNPEVTEEMLTEKFDYFINKSKDYMVEWEVSNKKKVVLRRDLDGRAHKLKHFDHKTGKTYESTEKMNHYNIDIHEKRMETDYSGRSKQRWQESYKHHVVVDENGYAKDHFGKQIENKVR